MDDHAPGPDGSDDEPVDELPEDLDVSAVTGSYEFPDNGRRRIPGAIYLVAGALTILGWFVGRSSDAVLVNEGLLVVGVLLLVVGLVHFWTGWHLEHDDKEALVTARAASPRPSLCPSRIPPDDIVVPPL